jgi:gliding motility-associated-like protein
VSNNTLYRLAFIPLLILFGYGNSFAFNQPESIVSSRHIKLIENKGQWDAQVLFKANIPGGDLFVTSKGLVYALVDEKKLHEISHRETDSKQFSEHNYRMLFKGANTNITVKKGTPFSEYYNYFLGKDQSKWASRCRAYDKIVLENIYNGIDAELVAEKDFIKLNFIIKPYADPSVIKLNYEGPDAMEIKDGALHISTSVANIKEEKPFAYQNNHEVSCNYVLSNNEVTFSVGTYSNASTMVIDPNIIFGTFSGSVADNFGYTATFDKDGHGFAGGTVFSNGFPVTTGAVQNFFAGGTGSARDAGILKFSSDGKELLYATYLGGFENEQPHSIVCNAAGDLYVLGTTESPDFPVTNAAYDQTHNGGYDIFIARLSSDGTILRNSTLWGGSKDDGINGVSPETWGYRPSNPLTYNYGDFYRGDIVLDAAENVYIASTTQSTPAQGYFVSNGFQLTYGGGTQDGCVVKFAADLGTVFFSTYVGGTGADAAYAIAFDDFNNIFVSGGTNSPNLGKNQGTLSHKGDVDAFVAKIGALGNSLQKLVFVGSAAYDQSYFLDIDAENNIYITGQTRGIFPVKGSVYKNTAAKQFVTILNNNLDSIQYSTTFGLSGGNFPNVSPSAFMVDDCGRIYFSGWGGNTNNIFNGSTESTSGMPVTSNAFQSFTDGSDFYLIVFSKKLAKLEYATFFGGSVSSEHVDGGTSRFDKKGIIYQSVCAGCGGFSDFPTTPDAYSTVNRGLRPGSTAGGCNNALFKLSLNLSDRPPLVKDTFISITATDTLKYTFDIIDPDGDSVQATVNGTVFGIPNNPPTVTTVKLADRSRITLTWNTLCSHASTDTVYIALTGTDNACIQPNTSNGRIKLLVTPPPLLNPPYPECLKTITDSIVKLKWNAPPSMSHFKQYIIYKKTGTGPFQLFATTTNRADTALTDSTAYSHHTQNYCYYIQTINTCNVASLASRTICSLFPSDSSFILTKDTTLFVTATDTLDYTFMARTQNPGDSVFLTPTNNNLLTTGRVLFSKTTPEGKIATYSFKFRTLCEDIKRTDTFFVEIFVRDNQCPQSKTTTARVRFVVTPPPIDPAPVMRCIRNTNTHEALVRWEKPTTGRYFSHFVLIRQNADGSWIKLTDVYSDSALSYIDNTAVNNEKVNLCYAAYAVNVCNEHGDTSALSCTVIKNVKPPKPVYIYTTSVEKNQYLTLSWEKSKETDFFKYKILKQVTDHGPGFNAYKETADINDTFMIDKDVDVHRNIYCYELKQQNDCKVENINSYRSCSILLKGKSVPFKHTLWWNEYDYWRKGVSEYSMLRQQPNEQEEQIGSAFYKHPAGTDEQLNIENGLYHYTIVARELNSPFQSISNTIELIQAPLLYVPNAFSPNGDNINDVWQTRPVFVKDYELKLYDRWGRLIYETTDKHGAFNGVFSGDPATCDVFVYLVTYTGWDGSVHTQKGNVTLVK